MRLIGMPDSPYVRRVAVSFKLMDIDFAHEEVSVFRHYDRFRAINPMVKAPTLVLDDGSVLVDSGLILDYAERVLAPARALTPHAPAACTRSLQLVGAALVACEKTVAIVYEKMRPEDKQLASWLARVDQQLAAALDRLDAAAAAAAAASPWLLGEAITPADVATAVAWRFLQFVEPERADASRWPALAALSTRAEGEPAFASTPLETPA